MGAKVITYSKASVHFSSSCLSFRISVKGDVKIIDLNIFSVYLTSLFLRQIFDHAAKYRWLSNLLFEGQPIKTKY